MRHIRFALVLVAVFTLAGIAIHAGDSAPGEIPPVPLQAFQPGTGPGLLPAGAGVGADLIRIPGQPEPLAAYVAWPEGAGPFPVVLVIQEWWGVNDWLKAQTRRIAGKGYVAIAVDLYRGLVAADADTAHQLMRGLDPDRGVGYLRAAFEWTRAQPWARKDRIGAIGWCMGGGYAADLAVAEPRLRAAVINYGRLPTDAKKIKRIKCPLLGNFGGRDKGIPLTDARAFKATLEKSGGRMELHEWPNAGHAFMNETNSNHSVADALNAWFYIDQFLSMQLAK